MEFPIFHFVPTASCPVTDHHRGDSGAVSFTLSPQVFTHAGKTPPSTLLQAELSQLSQPHRTHRASSPSAPSRSVTSHPSVVYGEHRQVSPVPSRREQPRSSTCWQRFPAQPGTPFTCFAARTRCWRRVRSSTGTPGPFLQGQSPACTTAGSQWDGGHAAARTPLISPVCSQYVPQYVASGVKSKEANTSSKLCGGNRHADKASAVETSYHTVVRSEMLEGETKSDNNGKPTTSWEEKYR